MPVLIDKILDRLGYARKALQSEQARRLAMQIVMDLQHDEPVPPAGRQSREESVNIFGAISSFNNFWEGVDHVLPLDVLDFIVRNSVINPDLNHATTNVVNMANNGHKLIIEAASDRIVEAAQERLNEKAKSLYTHSAGIDGLINHYVEQVLVTGAVSSEDVVSPKMDGVDKVVIVPTRRIRFEYVDDHYVPKQKVAEGDLIELNPVTYKYYAFRTVENSPYAIPLYAAAVEALTRQQDMNKNLAFIIKKLGLLGLVSMVLTPPKKGSKESDAEHNSKLTTHLNNVIDALEKNFYQGLMVHYSDMEMNHTNITGEARGAKDIWDMNEEQVASGAGLDGGVIGKNFHVTDAFANVVYRYFIGQVNNIRRLPKRRMEATYSLDLRLVGIPVEAITMSFNANPARDPQSEAQAEATRNADIIRKAKEGIIEPDVAAQEMGYDEWFDPERLGSDESRPLAMLGKKYSVFSKQCSVKRVFRYEQDMQSYRFIRPSAGRWLLDAGRWSLVSEETVRKTIEKFGKKYLEAIRPFLDDANDDALGILEGILRGGSIQKYPTAQAFSETVFAAMSNVYVDAFRSRDAQQAIRESVDEIYGFYRKEDVAAFAAAPAVQFSFDALDTRTMNFMRRVDRFYLSKWIFNEPTEKQVLDFMKEQYLEKGAGIFGRTNADNIAEVISLATDMVEPLTAFEARRIVDTAVQRMRNWGNIGELDEAGFKTARYFNPSPEAEICKWITVPPNNIIVIADARQAVDDLTRLSPDNFANKLKQVTLDNVRFQGVDSAVRAGLAIPPLHPHCHTRLIAESTE
ncbi:MAG: hypothetical protein ACE5I1_11895 [bacterium]